MEKKVIKIKYKAGLLIKGKVAGEDYKEPQYDYTTASVSCVKRYNDALMLLMGIDGCERNLMDWIADNMTGGNYISNNEITRRNFIQFHQKYRKNGNKVYSDKTVSIAFQRLSAAGFLITMVRGTFMVNPEYYYAGDDADRVGAIKMVMEFKHNQETSFTVDLKK